MPLTTRCESESKPNSSKAFNAVNCNTLRSLVSQLHCLHQIPFGRTQIPKSSEILVLEPLPPPDEAEHLPSPDDPTKQGENLPDPMIPPSGGLSLRLRPVTGARFGLTNPPGTCDPRLGERRSSAPRFEGLRRTFSSSPVAWRPKDPKTPRRSQSTVAQLLKWRWTKGPPAGSRYKLSSLHSRDHKQ